MTNFKFLPAVISLITTVSLLTTPLIRNSINDSSLKVTNGSDVRDGKYPWFCTVTIETSNINAIGAGGALIAPDWVLTASHIAANFHPENPKTNAKVVFGLYDRVNYQPSKLEVRKAIKIITWAGDNKIDLAHDAALIQLDKPITDITPITLASSEMQKPQPGTKVTVMGYGVEAKPNGTTYYPTHLQEAAIPVQSDSVAQDPRWTIQNFDSEYNFIAGTLEGLRINSSKSDSGGPVVSKKDGQYILQGIVSHGPANEKEDWTKPEPAVYTYVGAFNKWINDNIKK